MLAQNAPIQSAGDEFADVAVQAERRGRLPTEGLRVFAPGRVERGVNKRVQNQPLVKALTGGIRTGSMRRLRWKRADG